MPAHLTVARDTIDITTGTDVITVITEPDLLDLEQARRPRLRQQQRPRLQVVAHGLIAAMIALQRMAELHGQPPTDATWYVAAVQVVDRRQP